MSLSCILDDRPARVTPMAEPQPALNVLGQDYVFPHALEGLPSSLSDFPELKLNAFTTSDHVTLAYWEAGQGQSLIFIPGWSANGAIHINLLYLLSQHYHVYVLDPRNQGLSQHVCYGNRIARFAMDVKEFGDHLKVNKASYVGWSMGASVLWSYIDLFGTDRFDSLVFVDEPISIYSHQDWSEEERSNAGGTTTFPERMIEAFILGKPTNSLVTDLQTMQRSKVFDSPFYENSESFAASVIDDDAHALGRVLFDHITNDWRDVIQHKINVPVAIFSGECSSILASQRWMCSTLPEAKLFIYSKEDEGDHFLMFKHPFKFAKDLRAFIRNASSR